MLTLDLIVLTLLLTFAPTHAEIHRARTLRHRRMPELIVVLFLVGVPSGLALASVRPGEMTSAGQIVGKASAVKLAPNEWEGTLFPLLDWIDIPVDLRKGEWTVVFYRGTCRRCILEVPKYEQQSREESRTLGRSHIAFVEVPPHGSNLVSANSPSAVGRLSDEKEWLVATPLVIRLSEGVVVRVVQDGADG
jgi:hypothetical protein